MYNLLPLFNSLLISFNSLLFLMYSEYIDFAAINAGSFSSPYSGLSINLLIFLSAKIEF